MSSTSLSWLSQLITRPENSFREAYTLGPEKLERHDHGGAHDSEARRRVSPDETYQKAFDRLQKSMTQAERKVHYRYILSRAEPWLT